MKTKPVRNVALGVCVAVLLGAVGCRDQQAPAPAVNPPQTSAPGAPAALGGVGSTGDPVGAGAGGAADAANLGPGAPVAAGAAPGVGAGSPYLMDPVLAARYGLVSAEGGPAPGAGGGGMDPEMAKRYGLGPRPVPAPEINTSEPAELLKLGLFEEEGNRAPTKAIAYYEKLVRMYDGQRGDAATAIFRLAECCRKLGQTNEARQYYQRVVAEFTERTELVAIARQNLVGMAGGAASATPGMSGVATESRSAQNGLGFVNSTMTLDFAPAPNPPPLIRPGSTGSDVPPPGSLRSASPPPAPVPGLVMGLEKSPVELAELDRNIAFLEAKLAQGDEEVFASAIRLVFPSDRVLAEMEDYVARMSRTVVDRQARAKSAQGTLGELEKQRAQLEAKVNAAEAATKAGPGGKASAAEAELKGLIPMLGQVLSSIEQQKRAIRDVAVQETMHAKGQVRVAARRQELLRSARLEVVLARAVAGQPSPEEQTRTTLELLEKAGSPEARSALIRLAFKDRKLEELVSALRGATVRADEVQAQGEGDVTALSGVEHARKLLLEREQELVRTARLRLELGQKAGAVQSK